MVFNLMYRTVGNVVKEALDSASRLGISNGTYAIASMHQLNPVLDGFNGNGSRSLVPGPLERSIEASRVGYQHPATDRTRDTAFWAQYSPVDGRRRMSTNRYFGGNTTYARQINFARRERKQKKYQLLFPKLKEVGMIQVNII